MRRENIEPEPERVPSHPSFFAEVSRVALLSPPPASLPLSAVWTTELAHPPFVEAQLDTELSGTPLTAPATPESGAGPDVSTEHTAACVQLLLTDPEAVAWPPLILAVTDSQLLALFPNGSRLTIGLAFPYWYPAPGLAAGSGDRNWPMLGTYCLAVRS